MTGGEEDADGESPPGDKKKTAGAVIVRECHHSMFLRGRFNLAEGVVLLCCG
jgi:hypothetical protein